MPPTYVKIVLIFCTLSFLPSISQSSPKETSTKLEELITIPYVDHVSVPNTKKKKEAGTVLYQKRKAVEGLNIYCSRVESQCFLTDMEGEFIHTWKDPKGTREVWIPGHLNEDGSLLVLAHESRILKIDWNSNILWEKPYLTHHDLDVDESGNIYFLTRQDRVVLSKGIELPIFDDIIIILSPQGEVMDEISIFEAMGRKILPVQRKKILNWPPRKDKVKRVKEHGSRMSNILGNESPSDIFHTNTINILRKKIKNIGEKGDLLICIRKWDTIAVLDPITKKCKWKWGLGKLGAPHQPTPLKSGHIVIFDNRPLKGQSRVVELDPRKEEIVWSYPQPLTPLFFSNIMGDVQILSRNNILMTISNKGEVIEVNRKTNEVVWKFLNPGRDSAGNRHTIYRMRRYPQYKMRAGQLKKR